MSSYQKADEFRILVIATINGLFVFHLQVINKVDEQYSANWHIIHYSI